MVGVLGIEPRFTDYKSVALTIGLYPYNVRVYTVKVCELYVKEVLCRVYPNYTIKGGVILLLH